MKKDFDLNSRKVCLLEKRIEEIEKDNEMIAQAIKELQDLYPVCKVLTKLVKPLEEKDEKGSKKED